VTFGCKKGCFGHFRDLAGLRDLRKWPKHPFLHPKVTFFTLLTPKIHLLPPKFTKTLHFYPKTLQNHTKPFKTTQNPYKTPKTHTFHTKPTLFQSQTQHFSPKTPNNLTAGWVGGRGAAGRVRLLPNLGGPTLRVGPLFCEL